MQFKLRLDLHSYWHAGTGQSQGAYADALVLKDSDGIAYLSGKSLKGVIRDGFMDALEAGWLNIPPDVDDYIEQVFGAANSQVTNSQVSGLAQGAIKVSNARLAPADHAHIVAHPELKDSLYQTLHSTAIDADTGTATDMSLRSIEVAIAMPLEATIYLADNAASTGFDDTEYAHVTSHFAHNFEQATAFMYAVGANKQKGLGDVSFILDSQEAVA